MYSKYVKKKAGKIPVFCSEFLQREVSSTKKIY